MSSLTIFSNLFFDHGMMLFARCWNQFQEDLLRQMGLPMVGQLCIADEAKEDDPDARSKLPCEYSLSGSCRTDQIQ